MRLPSLKLGKVDKGSMPADKLTFLSAYHASMSKALKEKMAFRDEGDGSWRKFEEIEGNRVSELQQFLKETGFMPQGTVDGVFGYVTLAAVRLFQEYIRTVEKDASIGTPDGIAGTNTFRHVENWKSKKKGTPGYVSKWGQSSAENGSAEFNKWIALLATAKEHYIKVSHPILKCMDKIHFKSDTKKVQDWDTTNTTIHLIGVRRNQDISELKRQNDDLFILLVNGLVFKFWGSTDPSQAQAFNETTKKGRKDEPFLLEGQHEYRFAWHKVSDGRRVYRALKPARYGVLVFRDRDNNNALTDEDLVKGLDDEPNNSINIHWSGKGQTNYSAGCQVIAGRSYINPDDEIIDCSSFASSGYGGLSRNKTRGAYNMLTDLILNFAPDGVHSLVYTLARDDSAFLSDDFDETTIENWVKKMQNT